MFFKLLCILLSIFIIWQLFVYLRVHPEAFSKDNLSHSIFTLGILALLLIGFIAILIFLVKH
ncbi:MAG: hypothetical protein LBL17_04950 [Coxiellaceae bacterium]|jgi:hypothetical protein|nr:hypothetical protein [Coxiellaceae bacterium]